jgi:hypothetical protein
LTPSVDWRGEKFVYWVTKASHLGEVLETSNESDEEGKKKWR